VNHANEKAALLAEISQLEAAAPLSARETARYLEVERRLLALENPSPMLADAHSKNPPEAEHG